MSDEIGEQRIELLYRHGVVVVPPDHRFGLGVANDELVLRTAAGMCAGLGDQRPAHGDLRLAELQGVFIELRRAQIPMDGGQVAKAKTVRAEVSIVLALLDHHTLPIAGFWNSDNPMLALPTVNSRPSRKRVEPRQTMLMRRFATRRERVGSSQRSPRLLGRPQFA